VQSNGKGENFKDIGLTEKMILFENFEKLWARIGKIFSTNNVSKLDLEATIRQVRSVNE